MRFENTLIMRKVIGKMRHGYSPLILTTGPPNSGKTQLSALVGEKIHPIFHNGEEWDCKKYTIFDMNDLAHKFLESRKKVFVIAEAGYDLAFDDWYSKVNKFFDKIVTTQRVMGNCYILNIPVGKDLARRHRRKINYIFKVKGWGNFQAKINRIRDDIMVGNEFKMFFLEEYYNVPLPKCHDKLKQYDEENKERIRIKLVEEFTEDSKAKETAIFDKRHTFKTITCPNGHTYTPRIAKPYRCAKCSIKLNYSKMTPTTGGV